MDTKQADNQHTTGANSSSQADTAPVNAAVTDAAHKDNVLDNASENVAYITVSAAPPQSKAEPPTRLPVAAAAAAFDHPHLAVAVLQAAQLAGPSTAVVTPGGEYSYNHLATAIQQVAEELTHRSDFSPGDRVAILLDNGLEYLAAFYGVLLAGGVATPLPPAIETYRLGRIVSSCDIRVVMSSGRILKRRKTVAENITAVELLLEEKLQSAVTGPSGLNSGLAMILFTSGSSGEPKGVMLSHRNLLENARSIVQYLPVASDDRALSILPFYHAYGNSVVQSHLLSGAALVLDGSLTFPDTVIEAMVEHGATSFAGVPEVYHALLQYSSLGETPLPQLRYATVAGGALQPAAAAQVAQKIAPAEFHVMYGQSEATARLAHLPPADAAAKAGSIGKAIPGVELRVLDEAGNPAPAGVQGELCARGPNISPGYYGDPATTAQVFRNGWLHTGDLATEDADGFIFVQARMSDLVKIQGHRLHPREVEQAATAALPGVRIAVAAYEYQPDEDQRSMRLAMFAIPAAGQALTIQQLRQVCQRELPRVKVPSYFEIVPEFPRNASLKLDRSSLSRRAASATASASKRKTA